MKILEYIKNPFKKVFKKEESKINTEQLTKIILDTKKNNKTEYKAVNTYEVDGIIFNIGDKVICRSNEPYPILIGKIIEFWDNEGKWEKAVPVVRNIRTGKRFNVHGVIKPYSEELMTTLTPMKPLEQWNHLVPKEARYTKEEMLTKEIAFKKREKVLPVKK